MAEKAAIYARVSTDLQRDNYSIGNQIRDCLRYVERKNYIIVGDRFVNTETGQDAPSGIPAYVDDYTSTRLTRPALDAAISFLEREGFDVLVVPVMDRWARDPYDSKALDKEITRHGAVIEFVEGSYSDDMKGDIDKFEDALDAKKEILGFVRRSKKGKLAKARAGLFVCGPAPYGYTIDRSAKGGIEVDQYQAEVIRSVFDAYGNRGLSLQEIENELNASGAKPPKGGSWGKTTIRRMLANTAYIGYTYYNTSDYRRRGDNGHGRRLKDQDDWVKIETTPIVSLFIFEEVKRRLVRNRTAKRTQPKREYLLSGFVFCSECLRPYLCDTSPAGKRRGKEAQYYRHRLKRGHCANKAYNVKRVDGVVWDKVKELLLSPESIYQGYEAAIEREKADQQRQINLKTELEKALAKIDVVKLRLVRMYADPDIGLSKEEFLAQKNGLDSEQSEIRGRLAEINKRLAELPSYENIEQIKQYSVAIRERLADEKWQPTLQNKRAILRLLHVEVHLGLDGTGRLAGWFKNDAVFSTDDDHTRQTLGSVDFNFNDDPFEANDSTLEDSSKHWVSVEEGRIKVNAKQVGDLVF